MKTTRYCLPALLALAVTGCASMAVTSDALTQHTAKALSLTPSEFAISHRVDDGVRTNYTVTTNQGATYRCYVTGSLTVTGRNVSDAVCAPAGADSVEPDAGDSGECNALLKAAGKCE